MAPPRSGGDDGTQVPSDVRTIRQIPNERPWASESYLRRLVFERRIAFYKVGKRVLISLADLDALVGDGRVERVR